MARFCRPDLILITSSMTYWYTGLSETIQFLRQNLPGVPIYLGGTYATEISLARRASKDGFPQKDRGY